MNIIDRYTYLHFAAGISMYYTKFNFITSLTIHFVMQYIKTMSIFKSITVFGELKRDSFLNYIGDVVAISIGWYSAYLLDF